MFKNFFISLLTGVIIVGCQEKKFVQHKQEKEQTASNFFPVTQYLLGQLNELDSLPVTPLKVTSVDGSIDSVWMKRKDIRPFAQPFITPVIDSISFHSYFVEKSFLDQTIHAFTFSYDPIMQLPDSFKIKRWDVYVDPDNNSVKRIYIVKQLNTMPQQTEQLTWKSGRYCKITTITEKQGAPPNVKEEKLIWNFNDDSQ